MAETNQLPCATRSCRRWQGEARKSDFNCDYPGGMADCASFTPELTAVEKELLRMLESRKPLWPFDEAIDTAYVRKLYSLYGAEINLVEKFFLWESYYSGKPARERTNPRLAFHKWCINGVALKKKYAAGTAASAPHFEKRRQGGISSANPPMSPFSKGGERGAMNINDLAAGIVAAKAPGRGDTLVAHGGMIAAATPAKTQPTQEELEARRQDQLRKAREVLEKKTDG